MKSIATRMIVFAGSVFALGTMAFGQTNMTAEIPFAFHTANGTLLAGTYRLTSATGSLSRMVLLRNTKTQAAAYAGNSMVDTSKRAGDSPVVVFACSPEVCSLKAIRTAAGTLEYNVPKSKKSEHALAVLEIPLKGHVAD